MLTCKIVGLDSHDRVDPAQHGIAKRCATQTKADYKRNRSTFLTPLKTDIVVGKRKTQSVLKDLQSEDSMSRGENAYMTNIVMP